MKNQIITIAAMLFAVSNVIGQVVINEYSVSNLSQFPDNYAKYEDWIELYNTSASPVNLSGYYLSDDSINNIKWRIPNGISIAASGFLKFWASGRNLVTGSNYHTNFKLSQTKTNVEDIVLSNPSGTIIDGVGLFLTQLGHSCGRTTNGASTWGVFISPTPGTSNNSAVNYSGYADKPNASITAGFYPGIQTIALTTTQPNSSIRYTLDGTPPNGTSQIYTGPITIPVTKVLKAVTFTTTTGVLPSFIRFETYFINENITLPVISIAGYQLNTLANGSGTLTPIGSFEYFDSLHVRTAKTYGEFDRHGQDSWANSQRSLDFTSRDEMGYNYAIREKLFESTPRDHFQRIIIRAAGDDNYPADHHTANLGSAHLRDAFVQMLAKRGNMDLDVRTAAKAIVFINGTYWGVYDLRERPDDHDYTDYYYHQDKFHIEYILTWGNTWAEYGGTQALTDWNTLYNYIMTNNMADPVKYQYVLSQYDAASLVDYTITNSFVVCSDWLNYNTGWWRGLDTLGTHLKWGYNLWDNDAVFDFYINYTGIPNTTMNAAPCDAQNLTSTSDPEGHMKVLNRLRMNPDFEQYYISRMVDLWNTVFSCDNMITQLDNWTAIISPEMNRHAIRWNGTFAEWQTNVQTLRNNILARCNALSTGIANCYSLNGPYNITIDADPAGAGSVKFNTLTLSQFPFHGQYYGGMDNLLQAIPNGINTFNNWSAVTQTINPNTSAINAKVNFTNADSIVAHFTVVSTVIEMNENAPVVNVYPTLFSNYTTVDFSIGEKERVTISLHSLLGDKVAILSNDQEMQKGFYSLKLDLSTTHLPAGVYLLRLTAGNAAKTVKLIYDPQ